MIKFLRKHKKEALAVFTVGLMIQFAVTIGPSGGNKRHETVAGTVAGKPIYQSEIESGRREWQALRRSVASARPNPQTGRYSSITESELGADVVPTIDEKPELFPLLVREARDAGMRVNRDEVESIMVNGYRAPLADADANREFVQQAVEDLLMVRDNMYRLLGNVKVSAPQREQVLAKALQTIQLKVVELSAADFATKVQAPTAQQVQEQFQKYANVAPGQPDRNNPFGFGYRLPDRVKVQYLTIDRGEVEKAVEATKTPYQWEVEGRLYYLKHRDEFLAPASQPTTAPTLATSQPTTGPAYKPFEQVRDDAIRAAREPLVEKLTFEVQNKLVSSLSADWRTFSQKSATTSPAATESDYPSYNYLKRLADTVRSQTGVNVFVSDYGRDMSLQDLQALGGISQASDNITSGQGNSFIALVMDKARAYFNRADKGTPAALAQLMQPAPPLTDFKQNVYIFRLTDAHTAEAAPNLDVVRDKVEADLKRQAGYEMAAAVAQDQLLPAAKNGTLSSVAMTLGKSVLTTDPFSADPINRRPPTIGASITLSPSGSIDFADEAFSMLTDYNATTNPNPVKLIRIPQDGKVYVAQLVKVAPQWDDRSFYSASLSAGAVMRAVLAADLRRDWFNPDAITQRIGYKPEDRKSNAGS